jgi:hypothetical protein
MKHARPDYDRIQDPTGIIPADEPVFLLRGQDAQAAQIVRRYAFELESCGGDATLIRMARDHAAKMDAWPKKKQPDITKAQAALGEHTP